MEATAGGNTEFDELSITYGGRRAPVFLFVAAGLVAVAALYGWKLHTPIFWLFAAAAIFLFISAALTHRVVIDAGGKSLRVDWVFWSRYPVRSRIYPITRNDALLICRAHMPESESGYGNIDIFFRSGEGKKIRIQTCDIREADFSCPQADYLVAQIVEATGLPIEECIFPSAEPRS